MIRSDAKRWLCSVREKNQLKRTKVQEFESIIDEVDGIRDLQSSYIDPNKVSKSNTNSNPTETKAIRAIKIIDQYNDRIMKLENEIIMFDEELNEVKDELYRIYRNSNMSANEYEVLKLYYFDGLNNSEVAIAIKYSVPWVKKTKIDGLNKCEYQIQINMNIY